MGNSGFALEPIPGGNVGTLLPAPLEKTRAVLMLLLLWRSFKAPGSSLHTHPAMHTPQTAGNCFLLSPDGASELNHWLGAVSALDHTYSFCSV